MTQTPMCANMAIPMATSPSFVQELPQLVQQQLKVSITAEAPLLALEVSIKKHASLCISRIFSETTGSLEELGTFWTRILHLAWHVVLFGKPDGDSVQNKELTPLASGISKLPILLLEDITDMLTTSLAQIFWTTYVIPQYPVLFGDALWNVAPNPCALPLLKVTKKLQRRFDASHRAELLIQLAKVYPLSERSANQLYGSHNEDQTVVDSFEEFEKTEVTSPLMNKSSETDYNIYQNFWKLQHDLAHPNSIQVADFLQHAKTVLAALENGSNVDNSTENLSHGSNLRYLTSARLLPIQVNSAEFALQILTQFCIVSQHLQLQVPVLKGQLRPLVQRAHKILQSSPEGKRHFDTLSHILESEVNWRKWKQQKCPDSIDAVKAAAPTRKRHFLGHLKEMDNEPTDIESLSDIRKNLAQHSAKLRKFAPSTEDFLDPYVQALDPEAGIEEEYHPRNSAPFGWRALRLLSTSNLAEFGLLSSGGNYEMLVRTIYERNGQAIPGDMPEMENDDAIVPTLEPEEKQDDANDRKSSASLGVVESTDNGNQIGSSTNTSTTTVTNTTKVAASRDVSKSNPTADESSGNSVKMAGNQNDKAADKSKLEKSVVKEASSKGNSNNVEEVDKEQKCTSSKPKHLENEVEMKQADKTPSAKKATTPTRDSKDTVSALQTSKVPTSLIGTKDDPNTKETSKPVRESSFKVYNREKTAQISKQETKVNTKPTENLKPVSKPLRDKPVPQSQSQPINKSMAGRFTPPDRGGGSQGLAGNKRPRSPIASPVRHPGRDVPVPPHPRGRFRDERSRDRSGDPQPRDREGQIHRERGPQQQQRGNDRQLPQRMDDRERDRSRGPNRHPRPPGRDRDRDRSFNRGRR